MTSNASLFSITHPTFSVHPIHTTNGFLMNTIHTGTIVTPNLTIDHTYLIPVLFHNLLLIGQLCELGLHLYFFIFVYFIQNLQTKKIIGNSRKVGRLFKLESLHIPAQSIIAASISSSHVPLSLWHSRLEHASLSKLQKLVSSSYLGSIKLDKIFQQLSCQTEKQHVLSFYNSDSFAIAPFDLIHSNV